MVRPQADRPLDDNVALALKALDADSLHLFLRQHLGAAPGASQLRADAEANSPKCMGWSWIDRMGLKEWW